MKDAGFIIKRNPVDLGVASGEESQLTAQAKEATEVENSRKPQAEPRKRKSSVHHSAVQSWATLGFCPSNHSLETSVLKVVVTLLTSLL